MELVYRPADGPEQVFELDPEDLDLEELGLLEQHTGKTFEQIAQALGRRQGFVGILRAMLFIYLRRGNPDIQYRDVKPKLRQLEVRPSLAELLDLEQKILADPKYPQRDRALAEVRDDIAEAKARGASGKDQPGLTPTSSSTDQSPPPGSGTGTPST